MKKFTAFLLVVLLIGPAIGVACNCCPAVQARSGQSFTAEQHRDCCPAVDLNRQKCESELSSPSIVPSQTSVSQISLFGQTDLISNSAQPHFNSQSFDPPFFFSKIPLYLAHRVFRL